MTTTPHCVVQFGLVSEKELSHRHSLFPSQVVAIVSSIPGITSGAADQAVVVEEAQCIYLYVEESFRSNLLSRPSMMTNNNKIARPRPNTRK